MNRTGATTTATAPAGTIQEAFFAPASIGEAAVGADASTVVLKPTGFTFGGAGVALGSVKWQSQAVEMRMSPCNRLANHHADFIALTGRSPCSSISMTRRRRAKATPARCLGRSAPSRGKRATS